MSEHADWAYFDSAMPAVLTEVERLQTLGLDQETAVDRLTEHFKERLLRELAPDEPEYPPGAVERPRRGTRR